MYAWPTGGSARSTHWRFGNGWPDGTKTVPTDGSDAVEVVELVGGGAVVVGGPVAGVEGAVKGVKGAVKGPCTGSGVVPEAGVVVVDVDVEVEVCVGVEVVVDVEVDVDVVGGDAAPNATVPMNAF
jgi:hypothetical protein